MCPVRGGGGGLGVPGDGDHRVGGGGAPPAAGHHHLPRQVSG